MERSSFGKNKSAQFVQNSERCWSFVPAELPPTVQATWELAREISEADRRLSELAGTARTLPNPHLLIGPFSRREAVLSSKIEGTVASLSDLMSYEVSGKSRSDYTGIREVHNYVTALEYGLQRVAELPVSLRLMRELHERLMRGVPGGELTPGEFRKRQNWIGDPGCKIVDAAYVPPPVAEMNHALGEFEKYVHAPSDLPPLVRMALLHYHFEAIHPFVDGNGRIGRLLITLMLVTEGLLPQPLLYLSAFFERHRSDYYRLLLEVSQHGNWTEWIIFFLRGVAQQAEDAIVRANKLQQLSSLYRGQLQASRSSAALIKLADQLFSRPMVTVQSAQKILGHSQPSAQHNIDRLVQEGILQEVTGRQRGRMYVASRIMEIVEDESVQQFSFKFGRSNALSQQA